MLLRRWRPILHTKRAISFRSISSQASSIPSDDQPASPLSSVHRGTAFENRAMHTLRDLSMSLSRVGGRSDGGIDLQGWWWLPFSNADTDTNVTGSESMRDDSGILRRRVRVLAQCKAERKKLGPNYVRELEGVLHRHHHLDPNDNMKTVPTIALLVSESAFTKATVLCALSSPLPFFLLHLPHISILKRNPKSNPGSMDTSTFASAIWNPALGGQHGVLGGSIDLRWELSESAASSNSIPNGSGPSLWWHGRRLESWVPSSEKPER